MPDPVEFSQFIKLTPAEKQAAEMSPGEMKTWCEKFSVSPYLGLLGLRLKRAIFDRLVLLEKDPSPSAAAEVRGLRAAHEICSNLKPTPNS